MWRVRTLQLHVLRTADVVVLPADTACSQQE